MNAALKGLLLTSMLITLAYSIFSYTGIIYANLANNTFGARDLQIYTYTQQFNDGSHKLILRVYGIDDGETLIIYDIIVNKNSVRNNPNIIIQETFPIKLTPSKNVILLILKGYQAGQLIYVRLDTNIGPIFLTIKI